MDHNWPLAVHFNRLLLPDKFFVAEFICLDNLLPKLRLLSLSHTAAVARVLQIEPDRQLKIKLDSSALLRATNRVL